MSNYSATHTHTHTHTHSTTTTTTTTISYFFCLFQHFECCYSLSSVVILAVSHSSLLDCSNEWNALQEDGRKVWSVFIFSFCSSLSSNLLFQTQISSSCCYTNYSIFLWPLISLTPIRASLTLNVFVLYFWEVQFTLNSVLNVLKLNFSILLSPIRLILTHHNKILIYWNDTGDFVPNMKKKLFHSFLSFDVTKIFLLFLGLFSISLQRFVVDNRL
jgi:hypothetical protein